VKLLYYILSERVLSSNIFASFEEKERNKKKNSITVFAE